MKKQFLKKLLCLFLSMTTLTTTTHAEGLATNDPLQMYSEKVSLFDLRIADKDYSEELNNKRIHHLKAHRHAAHATLALAVASFATAFIAKKNVDDDRSARGGRMDASDADNFNLHLITAGVTLASYFTTAYFGITAPKAQSMEDTEQIKWHKRLAFIHMPAMIIGPLFALKAHNDYKRGHNPTGVGKLHRPIMMLGIAALAGAGFVAEF
jgi:hypothetical protein